MPLLKNSEKFSLWGTAYLVVRCKKCSKFFSYKQYKSRSDSDLYKFDPWQYDRQPSKHNCSTCVNNTQKENLKQRKREVILGDRDEFCKLVYLPDDKEYQYTKLSHSSNFSSPGLNLYNLIVKNCKYITEYFRCFVEEHAPEYFDYCKHIYFITPFEYIILENSNFSFDINELKESIVYPLHNFFEYIEQPKTKFKLNYTINNYRNDDLWFDIPLLNYLIYLGWNPSKFIYDVSINDRCLWIHFDLIRKSTFEGLKTNWYKVENEYFWEDQEIWDFENIYYKHEADFTFQTRLFLREHGLQGYFILKIDFS